MRFFKKKTSLLQSPEHQHAQQNAHHVAPMCDRGTTDTDAVNSATSSLYSVASSTSFQTPHTCSLLSAQNALILETGNWLVWSTVHRPMTCNLQDATESEMLTATESSIVKMDAIRKSADVLLSFLKHQEEDLDLHPSAASPISTSNAQIVDYNDGSKYKGEIDVNRVRHGKGTYHYPSGTVYRGEWQHGGRHGLGMCEFVSMNKYLGYWIQGRREGLGVFSFTKERKQIPLPIPWKHKIALCDLADDRERFEGEFLHDQRHGFGIYYFPDGSVYAGWWMQNRRHGKGTYYFTSGRVYTGDWQNSQRHGFGVMKDNNGQILYSGHWSNDRKHGEGTCLDNGDFVTAIWNANKLEKLLHIQLFPLKHKLKQALNRLVSDEDVNSHACANAFRDVVVMF